MADLVANLKRSASSEDINAALRRAADGELKGILAYCDRPLVSSDFRGHPASAIVDSLSTVVLEGKMAKVLAGYENEWGYRYRVGDLAVLIAQKVRPEARANRPFEGETERACSERFLSSKNFRSLAFSLWIPPRGPIPSD